MHFRRYPCEEQGGNYAVNLVTDALPELAVLQDSDDGLEDWRCMHRRYGCDGRLAQAAALRDPVRTRQESMQKGVHHIAVRVGVSLTMAQILAINLRLR